MVMFHCYVSSPEGISFGIGRRTGGFHRRRVSPANGMGKEDRLGAHEWKVHHRDDLICGPHRFVIICWPNTNDTICSKTCVRPFFNALIYQVTSYHVISYHIISYYTTTYCHATCRQCHGLFLTFTIVTIFRCTDPTTSVNRVAVSISGPLSACVFSSEVGLSTHIYPVLHDHQSIDRLLSFHSDSHIAWLWMTMTKSRIPPI